MVTPDTSPRSKAEVCDDDLFGRAKTGGLGQVTTKNKTRKAPGALDPAFVVPSLGYKIYNGHSRYEPLTCVAKDATSICLAERKPEVWGK